MPAACHAPRFDALGFCRGAGIGMGPQVVRGQYVLAFESAFQICCELAGAQRRAILDSDTVLQEQRHVRCDNGLPRHFTFGKDVESERPRVP